MSWWNFGLLHTRKWGRPSPIYNPETGKYETDGLVWQLRRPCKPEDVTEARSVYGVNVKIDRRSTVGKADPRWTTYARVKRDEYKEVLKL